MLSTKTTCWPIRHHYVTDNFSLTDSIFKSIWYYHFIYVIFIYIHLYAISVMIIKIFGHVTKMSTLKTNLRKGHLRPADTQIKLGMRPVLSESSLTVQRYVPIFIYHKGTTLIRLDNWPGWPKSSLGAHAILLFFFSLESSNLTQNNDGTITIF